MISLDQLYLLFDQIPGDARCLYIDTFAMCCWMNQQGQSEAANKLLVDLFKRINLISEGDHTEFLTNVRRTLESNEQKYALAVPLRAEFRRLFLN